MGVAGKGGLGAIMTSPDSLMPPAGRIFRTVINANETVKVSDPNGGIPLTVYQDSALFNVLFPVIADGTGNVEFYVPNQYANIAIVRANGTVNQWAMAAVPEVSTI
jgi:hypothetical protein